MFTILRTRTLQALRGQLTAAQSGAEAARAEAAQHRYDAQLADDRAARAEETAAQQLRDLAQAHADRTQAERQLAGLRKDFEGLESEHTECRRTDREATPDVERPEGVIARYITAGGATVDITEIRTTQECAATCQGCGGSTPSYDYFRATKWAQAHAERCWALPRG